MFAWMRICNMLSSFYKLFLQPGYLSASLQQAGWVHPRGTEACLNKYLPIVSFKQSACNLHLLIFYLQWANCSCWEWPAFRPLCSWGRCLDGPFWSLCLLLVESKPIEGLCFFYSFLVRQKALSMIKLQPAWTFEKLDRHSSPPLSPGAQAPKPVVHVTHLQDVPLLCRLLWPGRVCHRIGPCKSFKFQVTLL